jgi:hypothetical protein
MNLRGDNSRSGDGGEILAALESLRRRGRALAAVSGLGWIAACGVVLVTILTAALGLWGGAAVRGLGWTAVVVGVAVVGALALLAPLRRVASLAAVARAVGTTYPAHASDVLSACQLASSAATGSFSARLLDRYLGSVRALLGQIEFHRVFPARNLAPPALGLCLALVTAGGTRALIPEVFDAGLESLFGEQQIPDSAMRRVQARSPVVGDLALTLRFPDYLGRENRKLGATSGGLVAPLGTTVILEGRSLIAGAELGEIALPGGARAPLNVRPDGQINGRFVVSSAGSFSLVLGTVSTMTQGPERGLEVEPDSPPAIRLLRPVKDVAIDESGDLLLEFEAEDDHGLSRIDLVTRAGEAIEVRKTVVRAGDQVKRMRNRVHWTPQRLRIGDESLVELEFEAFDDDTILGPKPGRTAPLKVRIMTRLSRHQSALDEQNKALDTLIDLLAVRLETPLPGRRKPEEAASRFTTIRRATEDFLGQTARLIHQLNQDSLTPWRVADSFVQIRENLSNQLLHEARLYRAPLAEFRKRQGVDRVTVRMLEGAVIQVDDLILDQQFARLVSGGDRLQKEREELSRQLQVFDRTRAETARRAVLDAIAQMERAVARLQGEIEKIRGQVGHAYINPAAVEAIDLIGSLDRLRQLLAEGDVAAAARLAADLEQTLARLMAGLESGLLAFRTDRFGEGEKFIGDLLDRVMGIESDQLQLRRQTTALQRRYQERLIGVMRGRIDPLVRKQLSQVARMRELLETVKTPTEATAREQLIALRVTARELELALGQGDLEEARLLAEGTGEVIDEWKLAQESGLPKQLNEVRRVATRLAEEVAEAYPKPYQLLGEQDRRRLWGLANKQRHLTFQARKLRTWIRDQGEETRFLAHRALASLKLVAARMNDGVVHLENKRARDALSSQTEALDELARLREDLRRGTEAAPIESRPVVLRGEVDIPAPDEYEVPPEFREDILEAMRDDLPKRYRQAIERYYEMLVR